MDIEIYKPYVVSADVEGLLKIWSEKNGLTIPNSDFFKGVRSDLKRVLEISCESEVEVVPERKIRAGLISEAGKSEFPIVSLDRAYLGDSVPNVVAFLETNRAVNEQLEDLGLIARPGFDPVNIQVRNIAEILKAQGSTEACLLDDVIFSGGGIVDLINEFKRNGIDIRRVVAGIIVGEGEEKLRNAGINARWLELYPDVIDEVCERDFTAGVPYSGRLMVDNQNKYWGVPYFLPFGKPSKWASIPETAANDFSKYCLEQSVVLWSRIEKANDIEIPLKGLPRKIKIAGMPEDISVVKALNSFK